MEKLTPKVLVALIVRLFAIGLSIYLVRVLLSEFSVYIHVDYYKPSLAVAIIILLITFLIVLLWKFPFYIASKLIAFDADDHSDSDLSEQGIYTLGFVLLGVLLLYWAISDTAHWLYIFSAQPEISLYPYENRYELGISQKAAILSTGLEFIMAVVLLFGAGKISRFIYRLRHART